MGRGSERLRAKSVCVLEYMLCVVQSKEDEGQNEAEISKVCRLVW